MLQYPNKQRIGGGAEILDSNSFPCEEILKFPQSQAHKLYIFWKAQVQVKTEAKKVNPIRFFK